MGKMIYVSDEQAEWLKKVLTPLSENDPYWQNTDGFRDMLDQWCDKLDKVTK